MTRKFLATLAALVATTVPLASAASAAPSASAPARFKSDLGVFTGVAFVQHTAKCVRINAPGSRNVTVEDSREVHIRLSKACQKARVSFDGYPPQRYNLRHLLFTTTYYIPGAYDLTFSVIPPKGKGKPVTRTITYTVEVQS